MTEAKMFVRGREVRFLDEEDSRARVDRADQIPHFPDEAAERAWWAEHTLSEEFWRNAEPVPDNELPPVRQPDQQPRKASQRTANLSPGMAFAAGLIIGGALFLGAAYLALELMKNGAPTKAFLPTGRRTFVCRPDRRSL
jgi:hypothetical protein